MRSIRVGVPRGTGKGQAATIAMRKLRFAGAWFWFALRIIGKQWLGLLAQPDIDAVRPFCRDGTGDANYR